MTKRSRSPAQLPQKMPPPDGLPIILVRTRPIGTTLSDPRACESMGSWAFRLQKANMIKGIGVICRNARLQNHKIIDVYTDPESTVLAWSRVSGRSAAEIAPMMLFLKDEQASRRRNSLIMREWALAELNPSSVSARHVLCPACLAEDDVAYWRRAWRLGTTVTCEAHRRLMLERCPRCHRAFIAPRRSLLPLSHCGDCGFDIRITVQERAVLQGRLVSETLDGIYSRLAGEDTPLRGLPCIALRRLLNLACSANGAVRSMEAVARHRARTGRERSIPGRRIEQFIRQAIEVRWMATQLVEDFATRRPVDFQRLVYWSGDRPGPVDWLAEFQGICANGGGIYPSAELNPENFLP